MKIKSVLVSQPVPSSDNSPYFEIEKEQKVKFDFKPLIKIEGVSVKEVRQQKIDLSKYTAIVFTSRNAIDHYFRIAQEMRYNVPDAMKYFCQSEAVAYYLQKYIVYRKRKIYVGEKRFEQMLPLLKKHKTEKFLIPTAEILKPQVPETMDKAGVNWTRVILYHTVSTELKGVNSDDYDMMVFFSPSEIDSLFKNFPDFKQEDNLKIATFGKSTVKAATKAGLKVEIEVPTPEAPSMTMAIEKYIKKTNKK